MKINKQIYSTRGFAKEVFWGLPCPAWLGFWVVGVWVFLGREHTDMMHTASIPKRAAPPSIKRSFKPKNLVAKRSCQHSLEKEMRRVKAKEAIRTPPANCFPLVGRKNR